MNISSVLSSAARALQQSGVAEAAREARSLLEFTLKRDAAFLVAHPEYELNASEAGRYEGLLDRRCSREPFQYITGRQEFYGLEFEVTPDVLIPRPETEILVEAAVGELSIKSDASFCEIGVGSGCISIAILHAVKLVRSVGVDIWPAALAVARRNAERHGVAGRTSFSEGDVFLDVEGIFDLIVSNPPYVPAYHLEDLQAEVRDFEPQAALNGGPDGLDIVRRIVAGSPAYLKSGGLLLLEIGFDQSAAVASLFEPAVWNVPEFLDDLQGIPRIVKARLLPSS